MKNPILIKTEDMLTKSLFIRLRKKLKNEIIKKTMKKLESVENKNRKKILSMLNNFRYSTFTRGDILKSLIVLSETPMNIIEDNVYAVRRGSSGYNKPVNIELPIIATPELSLLISKCFGDGSICSDWRFVYNNKEKKLIDEVIKSSRKALGKSKHKLYFRRNKIYEIKFSSTLGYILGMLGAPKGLKVNMKTRIPLWIINGNSEIKSTFLRGLFDDEACVNYSGRTRRILFALGKKEEYIESLRFFLLEIKNMLKDFGIKASDIYFQQRLKGNIILRFGIYGRENIREFNKHIGFTHLKKRKIINKIETSYVDIHKTRNSIIKLINNSKKPLNTREIADACKIKIFTASSHLHNLFREGRINKMDIASPMVWGSLGKKLLSKKEKVYMHISDKPKSIREIANISGVSYKYTLVILHRLEKEEKIVSYSGKSGKLFWKIAT